MLIGVEKRFVFVANTKTASTSIEYALAKHAEIQRGGRPQHKHIYMRDMLREYDFLFSQSKYAPETFFKFGVMRDPIDWIQSWFRYRKRKKAANPVPKDMTFQEFWERKDWNIKKLNGLKHQQRDYFMDHQGGLLVDYIIPYHTIGTDFGAICDRLGIESPLPQKNVSKIRPSAVEISEDLQKELRTFYAEDYELFNGLAEINKNGAQKGRSQKKTYYTNRVGK